MKLQDCKSSIFLPRFAEGINYACEALDQWIKESALRAAVFSCPWTLASIQALTDEELLEKYQELSLGKYYHDLPREYRNNFLFEQIQNQKILTTKKAIESLLKYILVNPDFELEIDDDITNHLFNYDLYITTDSFPLDDKVEHRIKENLKIFVRATAELLNIYYVGKDYYIEQPLIALPNYGDIQGTTVTLGNRDQTVYSPNKFVRIESTYFTSSTGFYNRLRAVYGFPSTTYYNNTFLKPVWDSVHGGTPYTINNNSIYHGYAYTSENDIKNGLGTNGYNITYTILDAFV